MHINIQKYHAKAKWYGKIILLQFFKGYFYIFNFSDGIMSILNSTEVLNVLNVYRKITPKVNLVSLYALSN